MKMLILPYYRQISSLFLGNTDYLVYFCTKFGKDFLLFEIMATKIKQIVSAAQQGAILFGSWLDSNGMNAKSRYHYCATGWLEQLSKGVYKMEGSNPTLYAAVSSYNTQLSKQCIVGAYTALDLRGYSHYAAMGKPKAYLFTDSQHKLPSWMLSREWDMTLCYTTTSFLGNDLLGVESMDVAGFELLISSAERAMLECLHLPDSPSSLLDLFYIMEGLTTLRPRLVNQLLERCSSVKVKRLFLYMAEKAGHQWYNSLNLEKIDLGNGRRMISPTGKYIRKYNMTIPRELAEYE